MYTSYDMKVVIILIARITYDWLRESSQRYRSLIKYKLPQTTTNLLLLELLLLLLPYFSVAYWILFPMFSKHKQGTCREKGRHSYKQRENFNKKKDIWKLWIRATREQTNNQTR